MRVLTIIFGVILIQSCALKAPSDFSFMIEGDVDKIDSKAHLLTRSYIFKDSTVNIEFTQEDLNLIYQKYRKLGIDKLPIIYEPKCKIEIMPTFFKTITITINGEKRKLVYNRSYHCEDQVEQERVKRVGLFFDDIMKTVSPKKQYKELKGTDLIFL